MPEYNRTGPLGLGIGTGRGLGPCYNKDLEKNELPLGRGFGRIVNRGLDIILKLPLGRRGRSLEEGSLNGRGLGPCGRGLAFRRRFNRCY